MATYFFSHGDAATTPPETDPAPVECTACGRTECDCGGNDDEGATSQHAAEKVTGSGQSTPPSTAEPTASPRFAETP